MTDLIRRGQSEGVFASDFGVDWIDDVLWALVHSGCEAANRGTLPRHSPPSRPARCRMSGTTVSGSQAVPLRRVQCRPRSDEAGLMQHSLPL